MMMTPTLSRLEVEGNPFDTIGELNKLLRCEHRQDRARGRCHRRLQRLILHLGLSYSGLK